ncbi:MAG: hypothetical protein E6147_07085 [Peptostreptococcus sp.]|uniref:NAD-dependent epimerase/dehydratase family protein n=1 Tax=Peptostreptococcus sp. TaxID=1262 RepID=UPI00076444A1|nr:NAD-dependent epimerase/dehydratase family protein [Peptostreptococcus sp.]KXA00376.1 hypothetical protein HMPREF3224_00022 [Anaerococcus hydrogenalis]MDU5350744.1 hypothetical protein [Peptostreptococcus sp.]MDU5890364.1 hypothetical protein [Peptostreptococcus sp.]MDU6064409.1 hypothetical protein [Anaerococcus sp.]
MIKENKSEYVVGILGATGMIGRKIVDLINQVFEEKIKIIKASSTLNDKEYIKVDINKTCDLIRFVEPCDVIINCIGTSLLNSKKLINVIVKLEKDYIDAFGWRIDKHIKTKVNSRIVLNSGNVPGLLGILVDYMCSPNTKDVYIFYGGNEFPSIGAIADIILSSIEGYGKVGFCIKNHKESVVSNKEITLLEDLNIHPQKMPLYKYLYLSDEILKISKFNNIENVQQFQIITNIEKRKLLSKACIECIKFPRKIEDKKYLNLLIESFKKISANDQLWYCTAIKCRKEENVETLMLRIDDSSLLTCTTILNMLHVLLRKKVANGIYSPFEIYDKNNLFFILNLIGAKICIEEEALI